MSNKSKKRFKLRLKEPKKLVRFLVIILLIVIIIIGNKNKIKKKENMSLIVNNEDVISLLENELIIKDDIIYLSYNDVKKCIDKNIYKEDKLIITVSNKKVAALKLDNNKIEINGSEVEIKGKAFKTDQGIIYLPISEMKNAYDIDFSYIEEYKNVVIDNYSSKLEKAELKRDSLIKEKKSKNSDNIEKLKKGDKIVYISEEKGWAKIRTQNGNLGFIKKKDLTNFVVEREELKEQEKDSSNTSYYEKNVTSKNIEKYKNRKEVIEEILKEVINKEKKAVKIIYNKDKNTDSFKRFKLEVTAVLKECGITVVFK